MISIRMNGVETPPDTAVNIVKEDRTMSIYMNKEEYTFNLDDKNVAIIIDCKK